MRIDLAQPPDEPNAARGYDDLYRLWKTNFDAVAEGRDVAPAAFAEWVRKVQVHLDPRESRFFNEPFGTEIQKAPELLQARTNARLYKILLDRRGFNASKENGGLG